MSLADDRGETTLLDSHGLIVKDQSYRAVLTNRRIILTSGTDHIPRSIILQGFVRIDLATDPSGDPTIIISVPADGGAMHTIILHFPLKTFPNALQLRNLWASEINRLLQLSVQGTFPVSRQASRSVPAFCSKCGNNLAGGSAFCDRCGARVLCMLQPYAVSRDYGQGQGHAGIPDIALGTIDVPLSDQSQSTAAKPRGREKIPVAASPGKDLWNKRTLFASTLIKKPGIIVGVVLIAIVVAAAVLVITEPSRGFHAEKPASSDTILSLPVLGAVSMPAIPVTDTGASQETPGSPPISQETVLSESAPSRSALSLAPGDPGEVLAKYPSLFNSADGAGFRPLLSENMKIQHSTDRLNTELETARTKGYSINKIQVTAQSVDEETADVITSVFWDIGDSSFTSSPRIFFVYEDSQWKLDSLVLSPDDS
jgi:hypothetical protein